MKLTSPISAATLLLMACGGGDGTAKTDTSNMQAESGCAKPDSTAVAKAVLDYIMTAAPRPQRFLTAAGTDSQVPEDGLKILQDKGPTFFYAGNEGALKKLRDKLEYDGPYATMLVVVKADELSGDGKTEQVTVAGHYIANQQHGTSAAPRTFQFNCDSSRWVRATPAATPSQ